MGGHGVFNTRLEGNGTTSAIPDDQQQTRPPTQSPKRPTSNNERTNTSIRHTPTIFSLRTEDEIDHAPTSAPQYNTIEDSSFGIRSIESNIGDVATTGSTTISTNHQTSSPTALDILQQVPNSPASSPSSANPPEISQPSPPQSLPSSPPRSLIREASAGALSGPLPLYQSRSPYRDQSSNLSSTPRSSSLRSLRLSDDDAVTDSQSQAVESNDDEEDHADVHELDQWAHPLPTPELVMPSMSIPQRRPFTDSGRRIGRLTIAIVGRPASGKKSLLRAIVQSCEDIVHFDAPTSKGNISHTTASTRPYPTWWSEVEGGRPALHRRRSGSLNEAILERNITFLLASTSSADDTSSTRAIIKHFEERFARNLDLALLGDGEILSLLSGNGGSLVDLVLYVLPPSPNDADMQALADLSKLATVVPTLGQADTLSEDEIRMTIRSVHQAMKSQGIEIPSLGTGPNQSKDTPTIWPISAATYTDDDNMDASLLMNSCYMQPLAPSSLSELVRTIFNTDTTARLRHLSALKFLAWRRGRVQSSPRSSATDAEAGQQTTNAASSNLSSPSTSQVLVSRPNVITNIPPYTLTGWAANLQHSLRNERDRYQRVPSEDRRGWLIDRWQNGKSPVRSDRGRDVEKADALAAETHESKLDHRHTAPLNHCAGPLQDPLGLLACDDLIRRNGTLIARILGGCGVLGAIALWAMKTWGWGEQDGDAGYWGGGWIL